MYTVFKHSRIKKSRFPPPTHTPTHKITYQLMVVMKADWYKIVRVFWHTETVKSAELSARQWCAITVTWKPPSFANCCASWFDTCPVRSFVAARCGAFCSCAGQRVLAPLLHHYHLLCRPLSLTPSYSLAFSDAVLPPVSYPGQIFPHSS